MPLHGPNQFLPEVGAVSGWEGGGGGGGPRGRSRELGSPSVSRARATTPRTQPAQPPLSCRRRRRHRLRCRATARLWRRTLTRCARWAAARCACWRCRWGWSPPTLTPTSRAPWPRCDRCTMPPSPPTPRRGCSPRAPTPTMVRVRLRACDTPPPSPAPSAAPPPRPPHPTPPPAHPPAQACSPFSRLTACLGSRSLWRGGGRTCPRWRTASSSTLETCSSAGPTVRGQALGGGEGGGLRGHAARVSPRRVAGVPPFHPSAPPPRLRRLPLTPPLAAAPMQASTALPPTASSTSLAPSATRSPFSGSQTLTPASSACPRWVGGSCLKGEGGTAGAASQRARRTRRANVHPAHPRRPVLRGRAGQVLALHLGSAPAGALRSHACGVLCQDGRGRGQGLKRHAPLPRCTPPPPPCPSCTPPDRPLLLLLLWRAHLLCDCCGAFIWLIASAAAPRPPPRCSASHRPLLCLSWLPAAAPPPPR